MLKNYFKVAWRNLIRNKTFSLINILGLAIGLGCFLLISLYVLDELSYDHFYKNSDRTYRIQSDIRFGGSDLRLAVTSDVMGPILKRDYPQVEQYTRLYLQGGLLIKKGDEYLSEDRLVWADSTVFDIFSLPSVSGDLTTALNEPNTVVITETMAKKYFNTTDAIGKVLQTNDEGGTDYKVTAVIKDIPHNTHLQADMFFSMDNVKYPWNSYTSHNFLSYVRLKPGVDYKDFEKNFSQYIETYVVPEAAKFMKISSIEEFERSGNRLQYSMIPLPMVHFQADRNFDISPASNIQYVYIFSAVAFFILLIACINFMNLTTARSASRAREVGIRKVLGTERRNLLTQFLTESTLMAVFSLAIAIAIATAALPLFNNLASKQMTIQSLFSPYVLPLLIALPFIVGILAGSYPAFFLSGFRPAAVLKGNTSVKTKGRLRSTLVVFQFAVSIVLIIGTIVIYRQLHYIQNKNLGFSKDQVLIINNAYSLRNNIDAFKNEMLKQTGVKSSTTTGFLPVTSNRNDQTWSSTPAITSETGLDLQIWRVDEDYIPTMDMQVLKGRNFDRAFKSDSNAVILNETAARLFGLGENPLGKKIYRQDNNGESQPLEVIGLLKNFNFASLRESIGPLCLILGRSTSMMSFKVAAGNLPAVLHAAESKWKSLAPGLPFSYQFMDEAFDGMYRSEQRVGRIALIFSVLAIFIACLGLFGLATFIAEQRTKEIGIRKVLGASVQGIIQLLSKDFLKLVIVAFVIAVPLAWYFMNHWLQDFAYRVDISWWVFALSGFAALFIALVTVSVQALKAALSNPIKNLRTE